eukprot:g14695.t1
MSQEDSKNPLGSGTSHPPPQHAPPPGRTYNPIPEIGSKITQILKLRADFGEHRQYLLTNHILSPPGPQDISRQITRFLRQRSYYKHVLTPLLLTSPRRQWTLLILSKTLKRELQEVKDWISALGTAEVIHKKVELGVVAGPLNHTAGTEEDTIELHVKTFLSSPSGYQAWIQPRDRATRNPPKTQLHREPALPQTAQHASPARGILSITGMPGETEKISPSARTEPQDALNNERPQPARNRAGMLTLSTMRTGREDPNPCEPPPKKKQAIIRRANKTLLPSPLTSSSPHPSTLLPQGMPAPDNFHSDPGRPHTPQLLGEFTISTLLQNPLIQLGYDQISQIKTIAAASAKANTVGTPSWERDIWATQQDWKTLLVLPDNLPGAQWPPTPPLHLKWAAKNIWAALTVPPTTTTIPALQEAPPPIQRPPAPRQASNPVTPIPVQHTKRAMKRYRQRMKMKAKRAKLTHAVEVPPTTGPAKGEQPPPTKPKQPPHPTPSPASLTLQQGKQKNPQASRRQIALTAAKPQKPTQTPRTAKSKAPSNTKKGPPPKAVVKSEPATQLKTHRQAPATLLSTKQGPPIKRVSFTTQRSPLEDPSDSTSSSSSSEDADESEEEKNQ